MHTKSMKFQPRTIFSLLLIAALFATTGILGILTESATDQEPSSLLQPPETTEAFAPEVTEEPEDVTVFSGFQAPLTGRISSFYGYRDDPFTGESDFHRGIDLAVKEGTEISAVADGTVTASKYDTVGGNYVIISHGGGRESYYGHLKTRLVSRGDEIKQGELIGLSGATGKVTGAHLHFQLSYNGRTVDPLRYLNFAS